MKYKLGEQLKHQFTMQIGEVYVLSKLQFQLRGPSVNPLSDNPLDQQKDTQSGNYLMDTMLYQRLGDEILVMLNRLVWVQMFINTQRQICNNYA